MEVRPGGIAEEALGSTERTGYSGGSGVYKGHRERTVHLHSMRAYNTSVYSSYVQSGNPQFISLHMPKPSDCSSSILSFCVYNMHAVSTMGVVVQNFCSLSAMVSTCCRLESTDRSMLFEKDPLVNIVSSVLQHAGSAYNRRL